MFTWICPTCGREVPPSYKECPDCAARGITAAESPAVPGQPPAPAAVPPVVAAPPYPVAPPRGGLPTWLLTIVFALAFVGLGAGVYWLAHYGRGTPSSSATVPPETPPIKAAAGKENALQKYVEITGIRFLQGAKKDIEARFLVVNHSSADITDLAGTVNIWGRTTRSEEEAAGNFSFKVPALGPNESKEEVVPVNTKLKVYELPDWQNVSTEVQITSP